MFQLNDLFADFLFIIDVFWLIVSILSLPHLVMHADWRLVCYFSVALIVFVKQGGRCSEVMAANEVDRVF